LVGHDHRYLFPATYFLGGSLLLICDTAARLIPTSAELPVGLITACLGGPFFLWTLLADRRNSKIF
jgi:iron complex transport system permease protein